MQLVGSGFPWSEDSVARALIGSYVISSTTVTSATSTTVTVGAVAAVANAVYFSALSGQVVANVMLDTTPIVATVVSDVTAYYRADLVHGGQYQVSSFRFVFADSQFVVPALASCNLKDYLKDLREI